MGDEDRGQTQRLLQLADLQLHLLAQRGIQVRQRFIQQQHVGFDHQRPGQGHALLLAARHLLGQAVGVLGQAHPRQCLAHAAGGVGFVHLAHLQPEGHVLRHGHVREQGIVLEHEAHVAPVWRQAGHVAPAHRNPPLGRIDEAADHAQGGGLAAARRPKKRHQFAIGDAQRHVFHRDGGAVMLGDILKNDVRHGLSFQKARLSLT